MCYSHRGRLRPEAALRTLGVFLYHDEPMGLFANSLGPTDAHHAFVDVTLSAVTGCVNVSVLCLQLYVVGQVPAVRQLDQLRLCDNTAFHFG